jgi:hypothetical protein
MNRLKKFTCYTLLLTMSTQLLCSDSWWSRFTSYLSSWNSSAIAAASSTGTWIKENKTALLISASIIACYIYKTKCDDAASKKELNDRLTLSARVNEASRKPRPNPQPMHDTLWRYKQMTDWSLLFDEHTGRYDFAPEDTVYQISNAALSNKEVLRSIALSSELYSINSNDSSSSQDVYNLPSVDSSLDRMINDANDDQLRSLLNMMMQQKSVKYISQHLKQGFLQD